MVVDVAAVELDRLHGRVAGRFARAEPRARMREYVTGLVAGLERKNGWTLAERAGEGSPDGMQRLLRWADWDIEGVRDDVRGYVVEQIGDPGGVTPSAVWRSGWGPPVPPALSTTASSRSTWAAAARTEARSVSSIGTT